MSALRRDGVLTMWNLIADNSSVEGKLVTTLVIATIAVIVGAVLGRVARDVATFSVRLPR